LALVAYIDYLVDSDIPYVVADLEAVATEVCDLLPFPLSTVCIGVLDQYITEIVAWLENETDPSLVCTELGLCSPTSPKPARRVPVKRLPGAWCEACQDLSVYAGRLAADKVPTLQAKGLIGGVCGMLPAPASAVCWSSVDRMVGGHDVCGTCRARPRETVSWGTVLRNIDGNMLCGACTTITETVEKANAAQVAAQIDAICRSLPHPVGAICGAYMGAAVNDIVRDIGAGVEPGYLCRKLGICEAPRASGRPRARSHRKA
jgi:saposin